MCAQQVECMSVKLLLKQVYAAHTTRVKVLEQEIKELKSKVQEKERRISEVQSNCKKCVELEEAFKSCKSALYEQSKRFEDLGQRFSVFETKTSEEKLVKQSSSFRDVSIRSENQDINKADPRNNNYPGVPEKETALSTTDKISAKLLPSVEKTNLLKNVLSEYAESFDLCTVTFPINLISDNSCTKFDSAILVPDSLDVAKIKNVDEKASSIDKQCAKAICNNIKDTQNLENSQKCNKGNVQFENKLKLKKCLSSVPVNCSVKRSNSEFESESTKNRKSKRIKILGKNKDVNQSNVTEIKNETVKRSDIELQLFENKPKRNSASILDVVICKTDNTNSKSTVCNNNLLNISNKENSYQTSPSLLPLNEKPKVNEAKPLTSDHEDFQSPICISKVTENEVLWERCDKRKLLKKVNNVKKIRSSSRYKMTLDAPPPNYKKPTYRQTKLSSLVFQVKDSKHLDCENSVESNEKENVSTNKEDKVSEPPFFNGFQTSTPAIEKSGTSATDFDATYIPDNYKYEITPCGNSKAKINLLGMSNEEFQDSILLLDSNFSEEEFVPSRISAADKNEPASGSNIGNDLDHASLEEKSPCGNLMSSFDRLPSPEKPKYKYKEEPVRKRAERKLLNGFDCKECEKYYTALGLSDKEKKERMKKCSRHRGKFSPPPTPEHFWELEFPTTEECKARGYLNETQKGSLHFPKRRLPL